MLAASGLGVPCSAVCRLHIACCCCQRQGWRALPPWPWHHCCRCHRCAWPCPADLPAGTAQLLRSVSLFSLVNALAEKLRGVFVPYYGLLLDACVGHLTGDWLK